MNSKNLLLLVCILGFSSLAFAGIDVSFEQVDADGQIVTDSGRLLADNNYICTMILYSDANIKNNGGLQAVLNIFGPPYSGQIGDLDTLGATPSYFHNLRRIVYQGPNCDCAVRVWEGTYGGGKYKEYQAHTAATSSEQTKIDLEWCWGNKAASMAVLCNV